MNNSLTEFISVAFHGLDYSGIDENSKLFDLTFWNSLNAMIVAINIEEKYGVRILPGHLRKALSVNDLYITVNQLTSSAGI